MIPSALPVASGLVALPLLGALALRLGVARAEPRRLAVVAGALTLALALAALVDHHAGAGGFRPEPWIPRSLGVGVSGLGAALLPFAALIGLAAILASPRTSAPVGSLIRILIAEALTLAIFATQGAHLLALLWGLSLLPPILELRAAGPAERATLRIFAVYMGASALAFVVGVVALELGEASIGAGLLMLAVMIRKGITPVHGWAPAVFERAPLGMSVLFAAPQVGAYATAVLVFPREPALVLEIVGVAALVTAIYGAAMALGQREARRAFGYFFLSQSALVMVGFECVTVDGLTGGLCVWLSSGLALSGLGLALWVLEARRGRLRVDRWSGGLERMPGLAAIFLLLGVASVGFPGTFGFVGEELLVAGALEVFPIAGFGVAVATALSGITVIRLYFALFCGRPAGGLPQPLRPRETLGLALLGVVLVVLGLAPGALVESRAAVAATMLADRAPPSAARGAPADVVAP